MKLHSLMPLKTLVLAGATATLALLLAACGPAHEWHGTRYQDSPAAPALNLSLADGGEFSLEAHSGQVVLLYFGYTHCPDMCPASLADMSWVESQLEQRAEELVPVFVSVDPARDRPDVIAKYLTNFEGDLVGLYGTEAEIDPIMKAYGVFAQVDEAGDDEDYTMSHTARIFLIDRQGRLRANYSFGTPREDLLADVVYLLEND